MFEKAFQGFMGLAWKHEIPHMSDGYGGWNYWVLGATFGLGRFSDF
jgi:hypothetical protein